jgi:hypothetical protein
MCNFQIKDSTTLRTARQSFFKKTLQGSFHNSNHNEIGYLFYSKCVEKCTFDIKFSQIIINNNMWIKDQTGEGMAIF